MCVSYTCTALSASFSVGIQPLTRQTNPRVVQATTSTAPVQSLPPARTPLRRARSRVVQAATRTAPVQSLPPAHTPLHLNTGPPRRFDRQSGNTRRSNPIGNKPRSNPHICQDLGFKEPLYSRSVSNTELPGIYYFSDISPRLDASNNYYRQNRHNRQNSCLRSEESVTIEVGEIICSANGKQRAGSVPMTKCTGPGSAPPTRQAGRRS